ncbi:UDP-glucose 4-epimerase [Candidatus Woesearchaeota archaeon B3_Woes]|nr:MAG: UDP-glucose 4-epimerase [Candidatus Woesearchaeota archaeon B3_Woes]
MKILVTGGAGFIGSHIVDILIKRGEKVIIVDDLSTGKKEYINKQSKFYKADITEDINPIFEKEKPEIVIHTAAHVMLRESLKDPMKDAQINVIGTINILEACRKNNVKKIIYTSTGGARVSEPEYLPVDEKHPLNPCSPYGISKHTAEHYIRIYNQLYNLDYIIFCFGNVYGMRDDPSNKRLISVFIEKMIKGKIPTIFWDGTQTRDFIYVIDLVKFIVESINKNPKHKLFNLANGKQVSVNEVFNILKELTNFKEKPNYIEEIKGEVKDIFLDTTLAEKELNWKPEHDLKSGLKETIEWFKKV